MARPKGVIQKRDESKYWLPEGVSLKDGQTDLYRKDTLLIFTDSQYGDFESNFRAIQGAKASTHPAAVNARREATNIERFGGTNPSHSKDVRKKASQTMLERYGVAHALHKEEFMDKAIKSRLENCPDHAERTKRALIEKYGVNNPIYIPGVKEKMKATSLLHYGTENPMMNSEIKALQLKKSHEYYSDYNITNILPNGKNVAEYCKEYQVMHPQHANKIYRNYGPEVCKEWIESHKERSSSLEIKYAKLVNDIPHERINKKIHPELSYRPDFKMTDTYYVDVDGLLYHSERYRDKWYHFNKRENYTRYGFILNQFYQDEIVFKGEIVKSMISSRLGLCKHTEYARKLTIKEVPSNTASTFFSLNHLMGEYRSATAFGLYTPTGDLVSCISVKKIKDGIEISRFACKLNVSVVGGFSRLLKHVVTLYTPNYVQSFVDLRYADGHSLTLAGFNLISTTLGWRWTNGVETFDRFRCRANMDDRRLSEKAYAEELGWYKIFDAGQAKFILNIKR